MKSLISSLLLFVIPLHSMVAAPPKGHAQVRPVKGLIVVYDGSTLRENSKSYEYSELLQDAQAFKATLPNGGSVSGMAGQVVAKVDYERRDVDKMLAEAERIAAFYTKANPILAQRIPQLRDRFNRKGNVDGNFDEGVAIAKGGPASKPPESPPIPTPPPPSLAGKSPAEIFEANGADTASRVAAISELVISARPEQIDLFVRATGDADPEIRKWAFRGIGKLQTPETFAKLVSMAKNPGLDPKDQLEILNQYGRFGNSSDEALSMLALRELTRLLASASTSDAMKARAKDKLAACTESGNPWVRPYLENLQIGGLEEIRAVWAAADAQKARYEEQQRAFTPEDRQVFKEFVYGKPAGPAGPDQKTPKAEEGRLARATRALLEKKEQIKKKSFGFSMIAWNHEALAKNLETEIAFLKSGNPLKIGYNQIDELFMLYEVIGTQRQQLSVLGNGALKLATADPVQTVVRQSNGFEFVESDYTTNAAGFVAGALYAFGSTSLGPLNERAAEIERLFTSLSPTAQKLLAAHYAILEKEELEIQENRRKNNERPLKEMNRSYRR